jgi:Fe-S oxidoreductase
MELVSAIVMTALIVGALAWFTSTMKRKIGVLLKAKPWSMEDRIPDRTETMLRVAFAQQKMFKEPWSGAMHALIFWGFLILLFRTVSVFGRAYGDGPIDSTWTLFWWSHDVQNWYTWLKDWTELVVLAMVVAAAIRRGVFRIKRLTLSASAYMVLGMIGGLMVTDFLYDGAVFAMGKAAAEKEWAPVSAYVSTWLTGLGGGNLYLAHAMYWLHAVILLAFLNELPLSKHFHVIMSIPNVFLSKQGAPGALAPIKDIENQETFGVMEPRELTWRQVMDGYTCTECGRCTINCPAHNSGKPLSPKMLICDMRDYIKAHEGEILAGKDTAESGQTLIDKVQKEVIWSCTTCRSCEENCPVMITHTDKIVDYRRRLVLMEGDYNPEIGTSLKNLENKSNPWGLSTGERGTWVAELGVPMLAEKKGAEWLYFMGCFAAYDDRNKKVATAFMKLMQKAGVDFAVLGPEEACCGDPARRIGNEYLYQAQAQQNIDTFKQYGVKKIVTACPHCMNTIMNEYGQFGGSFEVVHHTQMLTQLVRDGKLVVPGNEERIRVVFHDSCYLGRYNQVYDEPRDILDALPGLDRQEAGRSRQNGFCCGAGGGLMFREEHIGERMNQVRIRQLQETQPELIASACPFCLVMMRDGVNELDLGEKLKTADVAELLAKRVGV